MHSVFSLLYILRADDNERVRGEWLSALDVSLIGPARAELLRAASLIDTAASYSPASDARPFYSKTLSPRLFTCSKPHRHRRHLFACKRRTPLNSKTLFPLPATCHQQSSIDLVRCGLPRTSCPAVTSSRHDQDFVDKFSLAMEGVSEGQLTITSDELFPFLPAKLTTH